MAKADRKIIDQIFVLLGVVTTFTLVAAGGLMWWGYNFSTDQVKTELTSQKISFPPKGSPALSAEEFPALQQYAGQSVDDGVKAKAYTTFIDKHLDKVAAGKTYSEVSAAALQDKTNATLQGQKQTLFMGETLRGLLLNAYAFWTLGTLLMYGAIASFIGAAIMLILVLLGWSRLKK